MATVSSLKVKQMTSVTPAVDGPTKSRLRIVLGMLWRDKFATAAVIFLLAREWSSGFFVSRVNGPR